MNKNEDRSWTVPDLNIKIYESWVRLVAYCQTTFPQGDLKIRIVNAQPTELLEKKEKVRFDKEMVVLEF